MGRVYLRISAIKRLVLFCICLILFAIFMRDSKPRKSAVVVRIEKEIERIESRLKNAQTSIARIRMKWDFINRLVLPITGECGSIVHTFPVGRLGNQLFHMATLYGLARQNQMRPLLNPLPSHWKFVQQFFDIVLETTASAAKLSADEDDREEIMPWNLRKSSGQLDCGHDYIIRKMFFNHSYFFPYKWEVRKLFVPKAKTMRKCMVKLTEILTERGLHNRSCTLIGAHMRRGDVVWKAWNKEGYRRKPASGDYLRRAIQWFDTKLQNATECSHYFILGDNLQWNLEQSPNRSDVTVLEPDRNPGVDMCLLMSMDHMIVTSGTFSFWAGFFTDGYVLKQANTDDPVIEWIGVEACANVSAEYTLKNPECWPPMTKATGPSAKCNATGICYEFVGQHQLDKNEEEEHQDIQEQNIIDLDNHNSIDNLKNDPII